MKQIQIYILCGSFFFLGSTTLIYASTEKEDRSEARTSAHTTQHPPHDHHETNHIKKLDEGMRKRRKDEE